MYSDALLRRAFTLTALTHRPIRCFGALQANGVGLREQRRVLVRFRWARVGRNARAQKTHKAHTQKHDAVVRACACACALLFPRVLKWSRNPKITEEGLEINTRPSNTRHTHSAHNPLSLVPLSSSRSSIFLPSPTVIATRPSHNTQTPYLKDG